MQWVTCAPAAYRARSKNWLPVKLGRTRLAALLCLAMIVRAAGGGLLWRR
jgi:hypothetical protein